jgi:hypothetical protein
VDDLLTAADAFWCEGLRKTFRSRERRAPLDEAARVLGTLTDEAKELSDSRLIRDWIEAARRSE